MKKRTKKLGFWRGSLVVLSVIFSLGVLFMTGVIAVSVLYAAIYSLQQQQNITNDKRAVSHVDPSLLQLSQQLGLDVRGLNIQYVASFPEQEKSGDYDGVKTIRVLKGGNQLTGATEASSLAHEYLHYVWSMKSDSERDVLAKEFNKLYNNDEVTQSRMKVYSDTGTASPGSLSFANELHSIYCTERSDASLSKLIIDECNRFINRSALQLIH